MSDVPTQFDEWLKDGSDVAALVVRQWLKPVEEAAFDTEGKAVIFPPTYPIEEGKAGYNIDRFEDGTSVCQIDSVGSQANRMEPIFLRDEYKHLVPQVVIKAMVNGEEKRVNLLEAGHRAADAIVRFAFGPTEEDDGPENMKNKSKEENKEKPKPLGQQLWDAFKAWHKCGDADPLARTAPTSIVFGCWDSRATQAKLPRIVRSVIRAYNVKELHRSAQYSTIAGEILEGGDAEVTTKGPKAELGLAHVPAVRTHGGIEVHGEIRRDASINFVALRALGVDSKEGEKPEEKKERVLTLRRYLLGLSLVALTTKQGGSLREGCHLVPDVNRPSQWHLVKHDGTKSAPSTLDDTVAKVFADAAADRFGVKRELITATFDAGLANDVLNFADRKKLLRQGPVTKEALARLKSAAKQKSGNKTPKQESQK